MSELVQLEREEGLTVLRINRASHHNAFDYDTLAALRKAAIQLQDRAPAGLIIAGAGPDFCAGHDLSADNKRYAELLHYADRKDVMRLQELFTLEQNALRAISQVPCPVIVAIEGACIGPGLSLALHADLRVAGQGAMFGLNDKSSGQASADGVIVRLARLVGRARTADLALTSRHLSAEEAEQWGLVQRVAPAGGAEQVARELLADVLSASRHAVKQTMLAVRSLEGRDDEADYALEARATARALLSGDLKEFFAAQAAGRPPEWKK